MLTPKNQWLQRAAAILALLISAIVSPALADTIDLSSRGSFTLAHGQEMKIQFSVWNYGRNNPGVSPYPTSIGMQLLGANPERSPSLAIPNSTGEYFPDFLLEGTLESLDGTASAPLQSSAAALLGLSSGSLVLTSGMFYNSATTSAVACLDAEASLSISLSEQIFGSNVDSRQGSALLVLRNLGADLTIGTGEGMSLRSAISLPSISGIGDVQTAGITNRVSLTDVPEPGTIALTLVLVFGMGVMLIRRARV